MSNINNSPLSKRRSLLLGALGATAAATIGHTPTASATQEPHGSRTRRRKLVLDVATRFSTFRVNLADGSEEPSPLGVARGASFLLEGDIHKGGTIIPGELFDIESNADKRIGHWFCWGNLIATNDRPDPHVVSTQEYVLGCITNDSPFPPDKLVSSGIEGSFDTAHNPQVRAVLGGSGRYAGAQGHLAQFLIGQNTDIDQTGLLSSTLRFSFDIRTQRYASIRKLTRLAGM